MRARPPNLLHHPPQDPPQIRKGKIPDLAHWRNPQNQWDANGAYGQSRPDCGEPVSLSATAGWVLSGARAGVWAVGGVGGYVIVKEHITGRCDGDTVA